MYSIVPYIYVYGSGFAVLASHRQSVVDVGSTVCARVSRYARKKEQSPDGPQTSCQAGP